MSLDFCSMHLVINNELPSIELLKELFVDLDSTFELGGSPYIIKKSNIEDRFFWLYAKFGTPVPYTTTVYNIKDKKEETNPRADNQIETDRQIFCLYSLEKKSLFVSSVQKIKFLEEYFKSLLNMNISIKAFYKSTDEFIRTLRSVDCIKFISKRNLFSTSGDLMKIFPNPTDLFGLGVPEEFSLEAKFESAGVTSSFKDCLKKMVGWKSNSEVDSLVCIGLDDENFEAVFNTESFIQKISLPINKDKQGMYDATTVCASVIAKLEAKLNANNS